MPSMGLLEGSGNARATAPPEVAPAADRRGGETLWRNRARTVWRLDVVAEPRKQRAAADLEQATSVLANFRQLAGAPVASWRSRAEEQSRASEGAPKRPVRIHPLVTRLIEPEVLEKLKAATPTAVS